MKKEMIEYRDGDTVLEGYCAYNESNEKKPAVLIAHDWSGKNTFAHQKAEKIAELGYVGFALDMFGKGISGATKEEKSSLIQPFVQDRTKLLTRISAALETIKKIETVDTSRIAAMGFCFGGLCVLDLARSGADLKGVVSFHGLLNAPSDKRTPIKAKILALHGYDDPMCSHQLLIDFADEMTDSKANWEINIYGNTMHAFTNPQANDAGFGTVYDKQADSRSWIAMKEFFKEVLS